MKNEFSPCVECLVRSCCSRPCTPLIVYVDKVLEAVEEDPNDPVLKTFNKPQQELIENLAKRNRKRKNEISKEDNKKND